MNMVLVTRGLENDSNGGYPFFVTDSRVEAVAEIKRRSPRSKLERDDLCFDGSDETRKERSDNRGVWYLLSLIERVES